MSVTQLAWRPASATVELASSREGKSQADQQIVELAATSDDSSLRIYSMSRE
jgi:hypothetical protein